MIELTNINEILRQIPKVDIILDLLPQDLTHRMASNQIKTIIDEELDKIRQRIIKGIQHELDVNEIILTIIQRIEAQLKPNLKRVINATGIILHTNLGRAVLSKSTMKHLYDTMSHYNTLEYDLDLGRRGSRYSHIEALICGLTGAEGALVVNNNAAAVMLILNTFASNKEVILSRGEMVEIGGSFRIPDVMKASGCKLVEVGTTNKTHLYDYENAISDQTAMFLKVHTSNYQILGFTKSVSREQLSELAKKGNRSTDSIVFYEDLGSGAMIDLAQFGLHREPLVSECVQSGVDIVSFSGDKLLGASQAGIIVGKKKYIDALKKNQLLRALRIDKLSLAVLEDTLLQYMNPERLIAQNPTVNMLAMSAESVLEKVNLFVKRHQSDLQGLGLRFAIEPMMSQIGGGALPLEELPSYGLCLRGDLNLNRYQFALRQLDIPIILKIEDETLSMDFRTLFEDDFDELMKGLKRALTGGLYE